MLTLRPRPRGVSLIELMVGLAVMAIIMVISAPNFSTFIRNSQIRNAAESIQTGLTLAKSEAVRRNTNVKFDLVGTNSSWQVGCVTTSTDCPASIQSRAAAEGSRNTAITATDSSLSFNGLGRITTAFASGTTASIDVTDASGSTCAASGGTARCLRVVVTLGGQIRMCDPALSVSKPSDPQAC